VSPLTGGPPRRPNSTSIDQTAAKRLAAESALDYLPERGVVGLGSGSTARFFIERVGALVKSGRQLQGVPTSEESRQFAMQEGIELLADDGPWDIDICVDGADQVTSRLNLIKGGGGCHTREKIVNQAARYNVILVDESKLRERLGEDFPVPVEVLRFAHRATRQALSAIGEPQLRVRDGKPFLTDSLNLIYDVYVGAIDEPAGLNALLLDIPGVVETGLFVGRADRVIVAGPSGVRQLTRGARGH
jgi:ribose 5-phosphate isomerase A